MPPRKSDQRKSDVSTARLALVEDVEAQSPAGSPSATSPAGSLEKKGKEKEKAKEKDQDKDKSKDHDKPKDQDKSKDLDKDKLKDQDKNKSQDQDKDKDGKDAMTIEDLTLPKSIITRLAKGVLPPNTQIQANAIMAMSKSATVFISYLAAHANENTMNAGKKTIAPADVFKALADTEFSFLKEPLEAEFAKFNAIQTEKRTSYRQKVRKAKHPSDENDHDDTDMAGTTAADTTLASQGSSAPRAKKQRVDPAVTGEDAEEDDAETEDEPDVEEEDEDDEEEEEEDEDEDSEEEGSGKGRGDGMLDDTQDGEGREGERDEALDGDESD